MAAAGLFSKAIEFFIRQGVAKEGVEAALRDAGKKSLRSRLFGAGRKDVARTARVMTRDPIDVDLTIGGRLVRYHPAGTAVDGSDVHHHNAEDDLLALDHPRLRRVLFPLSPGGPPVMVVLHWSDGSDLNALDERLVSGGNGDDYFANAIAGEFAHHLCRQCEWMFRVADYSTPLTAMLGIPLENGRRHVFQDNCPNCGAPTRRALLEFLTTGRKVAQPSGR